MKLQSTKVHFDTVEEVLSKGKQEDILTFVETKNLENKKIFKFSDLYYILKDKTFFQKYTNILRERKIFDEKTWSFSIYHHDLTTFKEYVNS